MVTATGTFVSCKDYDDDIKDLQGQIDKLATKEDMTSQIATLQAALTNAAKDASDAITKATAAEAAAKVAGDNAAAAKAAAEKSVAEAKAAAIEAAKAEVAAAQAALEKLVADGLADNKAELEKMAKVVEEAKKSVEAIVGKIADMVTSVELVDSYTNGQFTDGTPTLDILTVKQVKNEFGPNKEVTFVKDAQYNFGGSFIVRVSPTNAELTADMVSLINSKGQDLSSLITIGTPKRYDGDLLTRAAANTGLWEIPYNWQQYKDADMNAASTSDNKSILYAVAINNTSAAMEADRNVVSSFDLTIEKGTFKRATTLLFTAGGEKVADLKNRYGNPKADQKWNATNDASKLIDPTKNTTNDIEDNRTGAAKKYLSVKVGTPFDVVLDMEGYKTADKTAPYRFYVTLDKDYAEESSEPSELNAWNNYAKNTTGLNTLDENGKVTISINDETAEGDIIGYRVYAVNYDGTLVDPDGRAFYVYVGTPAVSAADLTLTAKIATPYDWTKINSTDKAVFSTADWTRAKSGAYTITYTDPTKTGNDKTVTDLGLAYTNFKFYNKDGVAVTVFADENNLNSDASKLTSVTKVEMVGVDPAKLKDGVKYTATITAKNSATGAVVATATITFTKQLPAFPSTKVYPFTNILRSDVLYIYPIAVTGNDKPNEDYGKYDMKNVWHGIVEEGDWKTAQAVAAKFNQVVTDAQKKDQNATAKDAKYPTITYPMNATASTIQVEAKFVNPDKSKNSLYLNEYPMYVNYNYGNISYDLKKNSTTEWEVKNWIPKGTEFKIVFRNYADDCAFDWNGDAPKLAYNGVVGATSYIAIDKLTITDWYNAAVSLVKGTDGTYAKGYIKAIDVHLLTGDKFDQVDEYYTGTIAAATYKTENGKQVLDKPLRVELTERSSAAQPDDVPTKLQFVITDSFGYTVTKTLTVPFTMTAKK